MPDNFITYEKETWDKTDAVIQMRSENIIEEDFVIEAFLKILTERLLYLKWKRDDLNFCER